MLEQNDNKICAPARCKVKAKKPPRSRKGGISLGALFTGNVYKQVCTRELKVFRLQIFKITTVLTGSGIKQIKPGQLKNRTTLSGFIIALFLALSFAVIIEVVKTAFFGTG